MIRTACAWVLVLLAASPVTAPFSTCELRDLFTPRSIAHAALAPTAIASRLLAVGDDANTVSPVLRRCEPPAESRTGHAVLPFHAVSIALRGVGSPPQESRTPHDHPTQPTVLRL
jgi:hypothetical protein